MHSLTKSSETNQNYKNSKKREGDIFHHIKDRERKKPKESKI